MHSRPALRRLLDRPVLLTFGVATLVHLWAAMALPLVLTADGLQYVRLADQLAQHGTTNFPPFRTPGYILFLAGIFKTIGIGPVPVLMMQHMLAVGLCCLISFSAARLGGPRWGGVLGVLAAVDPFLITFASYALSETLAAFLFMLAIVLVLMRPRAPGRAAALAAAAGLVIALACLVRPSFQVTVPFLGLAAVMSAGPGLGRRAVAGSVFAVAFALPVAPWLLHNHNRGVPGMAAGAPVYLLHGLSARGLMDDSFPLPDDMRASYEEHLKPGVGNYHAVYPFLEAHKAWYRPEVWTILAEWNAASIRANPAAYAQALAWTAVWQLDCHPEASGHAQSESRWLMRYHGQPGPTIIGHGETIPPEPYRPFAAQRTPSPMGRWLAWYADSAPRGLPQIPLAVMAAGAGIVCLLRRRYVPVVIIAATFVLVLAHTPILLPFSRFSFASWMAWYALAAGVAMSKAES